MPQTIPWSDRLGEAWQRRWPRLGRKLAALEDKLLGDELVQVRLDQPIYICGLPRAGTTVLLEMLASLKGFTAHQYADFPLVWTPYFSNWLRAKVPQTIAAPVERAHGDRIWVTRESYEAFEEVLWLSAWGERELSSQDLDASFNTLYLHHLKKLLLVRGASRYVSKNNPHVKRLTYLHATLPDARFVIPFREPLAQVDSMLRQEQRLAKHSRRELLHLAARGHQEWGGLRRPVYFMDPQAIQAAHDDSAAEQLAQYWLRAWVSTYRHVLSQLAANPGLAARVALVDYDAMCASPGMWIDDLFAFCAVPEAPRASHRETWQAKLAAPQLRPDIQNIELSDPTLEAQARSVLAQLQASARCLTRVHRG